MPPKELHNGTLQTTIDDADHIAFGQPGGTGAKNILWSAFKTFFATLFMSLTGNQTVAGEKTFTSSPKVPNPTAATDVVNLQTLNLVAAAQKVAYLNRTANFQHLLTALQSLERIDLRAVSGTVTVKIGTSASADDVMRDKTAAVGDSKLKVINLNGISYYTGKTLYITISGGGTVSINIWYLPAIF